MLLEDNDHKHTVSSTKMVKEELQLVLVKNFPPSSMDLNLIENVWAYWDQQIYKRNPEKFK